MKKQLLAAAAVAGLTLIVAPTVDARPTAPSSIVDVAVAVNSDGPFAGEFDTLIAAVSCESQAGVLSTLSQRGQYTVFAPVDAAFAALGVDASNVCSLDDTALSNILTYHVANGRRDATDVTSSDRIRMLNGDFTDVSVTDDGAFIDESEIIVTDVPASNGIIHAIDAVLLP